MKRNFLVSFLAGCFFLMLTVSGIAQAVETARFSDYFAGKVLTEVSVGYFDPATGIRPTEGLGVNGEATFRLKKTLGILPKGLILGAGYISDVEGLKDEPLAKVFSVGIGWMSGADPNMPQIEIGAERLDFHDFCGDAIKFHFIGSKPIWNTLETYYLSAIFRAEGIAPLNGNGDYLSGVSANATLRFAATADQHLSLVQEVSAGANDGPYGRPPAGMLGYSIYGKIVAGNWELIFPRLTGIFVNENRGDYKVRREERMGMVDFVVARKF